MRTGYTAQQIRDAEAPRLAAGEPLMVRAAAGLAAAVRDVLRARTGEPRGRVLVLVGSGNNGGDALFAATELARDGCRVAVLPVGSRIHPEGLAAFVGVRGMVIDKDLRLEVVQQLARGVDVIVDGILGIGATGSPALRGRARDVVATLLPLVAANGPAVVAVDIPSGIDADSGEVPDPAVLPADLTVTFGGCKAGLLRGPAVALAGQVRVVDVGISADLALVTPAVRVADSDG